MDDWLPTVSMEVLRIRAQLLETTRQFFSRFRYLEVDTPHLSHDACVDAWIDPIVLKGGDGSAESTLFLQTSPEFAMKRLVCAGADAIYQLGHVFRAGEQGGRHNPEFTMLEWYKSGSSYHEQMGFVEHLIRHIGSLEMSPPRSLPDGPFERLSYDEAFQKAIGTSVLSLTASELQVLARQLDVTIPESLAVDDRDGWLNLLLAERVEPWLKSRGAVFLYDYPESQSALARVRPGSPPVSERFELYLDGAEICNGYQELTDADELVTRMRRQNELRRRAGRFEIPVDSRLVAAMRAGMPECSGVALGFDRLVMWRLGLERIEDVIPFPMNRA